MAEQITCEVHRIVRPVWSALSDKQKEGLYEILARGVQEGQKPSRRALVGVERLGDVVAGFYAEEGMRQGVQYNTEWDREVLQEDEFEHLFFALALAEGHIVLQRKRISREFVTMNMASMRRAFLGLLGSALAQAGIGNGEIREELFREERQKEDMIRIFDEYQTSYVIVRGLHNQRVPDALRLFNPNLDKNALYKQILNADLQDVDEFRAGVDSLSGDADLRRAKMVQAMMHTGEPHEVRAVDEGQERTFRKSQRERFEMALETGPGEQVSQQDLARVVKVIRTEYHIPADLIEPDDMGPLFRWREGDTDDEA